MSTPELIRSQIEEAASLSPDMNVPNNDDPADEDSTAEADERENR